MTSLELPWPGLAAVSARRDLWPRMDVLVGRAAGSLFAPGGGEDTSAVYARLRAAGLSEKDAADIVETPAWRTERRAVRFIRVGQPGWPASLVDLPRGPVALSVEGDLSLLSRVTVAIVGSRACTTYGREWAARLSTAVVGAGAVVVSGLAAGIDLAAHGAAGGATIAVLGQGIDAPMPAWQQRARDTLLARGGCVVSELPPEGHASTFTFPIRNRIIAGLARAVAVVEAGERSGARNTATHALEYGRNVMAMPGPLGALASVGCLDLIEQGATVIRGVHTLLEAVRLAPGERAPGLASEGEDPLLTHLTTPGTPEELVALTGTPYPEVMARLGVLELTGRVIRLPGRRYLVRTR